MKICLLALLIMIGFSATDAFARRHHWDRGGPLIAEEAILGGALLGEGWRENRIIEHEGVRERERIMEGCKITCDERHPYSEHRREVCIENCLRD